MGAFRSSYSQGVSDDVFAVVPADINGVTDGTTVRPLIRQLYIATGGTVKYTSPAGVTNTITVPDGFFLECAMTRVWAGSTADDLLGYV